MNRIRTAVLFLGVIILLLSPVARAQQAATPKRILVLYWYGREWPGDILFSQNFQAVLESAPAGTVEYYPEYLESNRFPGERQSRLLRDYLRQKYADRTIDVIVADGDPPLNFLLKHRADLFPQTPIVFVAANRPTAKELAAGPGLTGILNANDYRKTLDLALRLHPGTKQVFVISGTLARDKGFEAQCREEFRDYKGRVSITYLTDLAPDELIFKAKSLPEQSIVLYVWQQAKNEQGEVLESQDVLDLIAHSTPVPIYGVASWQVGRGIVGGYLRTLEANGTRAAQIALRIAHGERAQDIPVENSPIVPMFDWRELRRWGISENSLPPGSIVRFKELSVWEQYKWHIAALFALIALQASLIAVLLIERRRRQRAIEALDRLNVELDQRVSERTAALAGKTRELEAFTYSVAHDLKAPLRGIDGYSRLLLEDYLSKLDDEGQAFLHRICDSAGQMKQLIDDLLAYSQVERREMAASRIELRPFIERLVEERRGDLRERSILITLNLNGDSAIADPTALGQAVRNYLDNSIKYTRDAAEPRIEIGSESGSRLLRLWVRDNGAGFDMKYHEQIFGMFQRLHRAEEYPGTGIGLAIARKAIERMGGRVWAESEPGQGARFFIELPNHPTEAAG